MKSLVYLLLLATALPLMAAEPNPEPVPDPAQEDLQVIVINSGRMEIPERLTPGDYQVLDGEDIRASGADDIAEALSQAAGLQITDQFGDGSRVSISMRGFGENTFGNTLILVDGRRLNNSLDIAAPTLSAISLQDVERIEILHGSGGVLFGENAVGGVINIVTRRRAGRHLTLSGALGSYDSERYTVDGGMPLSDQLQLSASAEHRISDNYRQNNQLQRDIQRFRLDWRPQRQHHFAEFHRSNENLRTPGAIFRDQVQDNRRQPSNFDDFQNSDIDSIVVGSRFDLDDDWRFEIDYDWRDDDITGNLTIGGFGGPFAQERRQWSYRPRLLHRFELFSRDASLLGGVDYERARYRLDSVLGTQIAAQRALSKYVLLNARPTARLQASIGIRHADLDTDVQDNFTFPNGLDIDDSAWLREFGLRFAVGTQTELYLRRADNLRFGKVDEHTGQAFGTTQALAPQTGSSWEAGIRQDAPRDQWRIGLYRLRLENEIAFDPTTFANRNLDPTRRLGIQAAWEHQIDEQWRMRVAHERVDARFSAGANENEHIPFVARYTSDLQLNWQDARGHHAVVEYQRIGDRAPTGDDRGQFDDIDGHDVVNLGWTWQRQRLRVGLRLNNALDERYDAFGSVAFNPFPNQETAFMPAPERNFTLRVEYRLGER